MDHIIKNGLIEFGLYRGTGKLLISSHHINALAEDNNAGRAGGLVGGALGALVGSAIDSYKHRDSQPEYLNDTDLAFLDKSAKQSLRKTNLLIKLPIGSEVIISPTFAGFDFKVAEKRPVSWRGLIHKGKVRRFLEAQGAKIAEKA